MVTTSKAPGEMSDQFAQPFKVKRTSAAVQGKWIQAARKKQITKELEARNEGHTSVPWPVAFELDRGSRILRPDESINTFGRWVNKISAVETSHGQNKLRGANKQNKPK